MEPYYEDNNFVIYHGDCRDICTHLSGINAIVTDPPYGIKFMSCKWDSQVPGTDYWDKIIQCCVPGTHMVSFSSSRTYHKLAYAIENSNFEIRDQIAYYYDSDKNKQQFLDSLSEEQKELFLEAFGQPSNMDWIYGSGMSKSKNIGKEVDRIQGNSEWEGWGTTLKPAHEPLVLARVPIAESNITKNVLKHNAGAINIEGCKIPAHGDKISRNGSGGLLSHIRDSKKYPNSPNHKKEADNSQTDNVSQDRCPANVIVDDSDEVRNCFPEAPGQQGDLKNHNNDRQSPHGCYGKMNAAVDHKKRIENNKNASRFFYCPKVSKADRHEGLPEHLSNTHRTVKPTKLMLYLCRLIAPPKNAVILDPFAGTGSTGKGVALMGNAKFIGITDDEKDCEIAVHRIKYAIENREFLLREEKPPPKPQMPEKTLFDVL